MTRRPRFEIVRTAAAQPWHARYRAANGRIVWTTETYGQARRNPRGGSRRRWHPKHDGR